MDVKPLTQILFVNLNVPATMQMPQISYYSHNKIFCGICI